MRNKILAWLGLKPMKRVRVPEWWPMKDAPEVHEETLERRFKPEDIR